MTRGLAGMTRQSALAMVQERALGAVQQAARRAEAAAEVADAVVRFALAGEGEVSLEDVRAVERGCDAMATRGDAVMALCDAARARLVLRARRGAPSTRFLAALACRSRPAVIASVGARPTRAAVVAYLRSAPDALPGLFPGDAPPRLQEPAQGSRGASDGLAPVPAASDAKDRLQEGSP